MTTRSILLAFEEPQASADIIQALGAGWEATSVANQDEALEQLEKRSFDALLVDFNLGSPDASELLNQALEKRPETVRFLVAYEADLALVAAKVEGTPHILPKPIEPVSIKNRIETGVTDSTQKQSGSQPANSPNDLPTIPAVYAEVLKAIESLGVSDAQVGEIIAQDAVLTFEVLRLTKSAYVGLPSNSTGPAEAVQSLGLETIKVLVMALRFLAEHSRLRPRYLAFDRIWQHSVNVGQIARDLILFERKDRTLASQALMAGLVHDLGKVVLVANFDDLYGRVHSLARKQPVTLWDIEKEMFGANHGEIGACLAGMWNLPSVVVEAANFHHEPSASEHEQFTPVAAVHIANVLERELCPSDDDMMVAPIIDTKFLNQLGLLQRLPVWRAAFANRGPVDLDSAVEADEIDSSGTTVLSRTAGPRTANQLPGPAATTGTTASGQPSSTGGTQGGQAPGHRRSWVYAGACGILVLLALWFKTQFEPDQDEQAYARGPIARQVPTVVASIPARQTAPATVPTEPSAVAISEGPEAEPAPYESVPKPETSVAAPEPTAAATPSATVTNASPPSPVPHEKAVPDFRLKGIIYTAVRPSAILNGQTVKVGDQVNGATVISISPTAVTLKINGQRKTYELQ